jgi:hypothetical protein
MSREYALTDEEQRLMDAIEADLDREMAVEPSPDFAARVRARIGAADRDRGWSVPWGLAAAAVLALATGILIATRPGQPAEMHSPMIVAGHDVALPAPRVPVPIAATTRPAQARLVRIPPAAAATAPAVEPEVLVPPEFRLAIGRVMDMVRARTLNKETFPREPTTATVEESPEPAPMVVEELQVPLINVAGGGMEKGFGS